MSNKLLISKNLNLTPKKIILMSDFINFCRNQLPIENKVEIKVVDSRNEHEIKTTAHYNLTDHSICIYGKNRALVDILRSIAHELTHMMQNEQGLITGPVQDAGGFHEDQANAKAGEIIKLFAKSNNQRQQIYESLQSKVR